ANSFEPMDVGHFDTTDSAGGPVIEATRCHEPGAVILFVIVIIDSGRCGSQRQELIVIAIGAVDFAHLRSTVGECAGLVEHHRVNLPQPCNASPVRTNTPLSAASPSPLTIDNGAEMPTAQG